MSIWGVFGFIDKLLFRSILSPVKKSDTDEIENSIQTFIEKKDAVQLLFTLFDAVDAKTAALLTHISLIVAALTFMFSWHQAAIMKAFIMMEIVFYLLISLLCLRCIRFTSTKYAGVPVDGTELDTGSSMEAELYKRRVIYNFAVTLTICATVGLLIILLVGFLAQAATG